MKKIDLEAHFCTKDYERHMLSRKESPKLEMIEDEKHQKMLRFTVAPNIAQVTPLLFQGRLLDMGEGRLKLMDEAGIDMQVLSLSWPCEQFEAREGTMWASRTNDELSEVVKKYPNRFMGWRLWHPKIPMQQQAN